MIVLDTKDEGLSTFQSLQGQLHGMGQAPANPAAVTADALEKQAAALATTQPAVAANMKQQAAAIRTQAPASEGGLLEGTVFGVQRKHALFVGLGAVAGYFVWDRFIR